MTTGRQDFPERGEAVGGGKLAGAHDFFRVPLEQHDDIEHVLRTRRAKLEMDEVTLADVTMGSADFIP